MIKIADFGLALAEKCDGNEYYSLSTTDDGGPLRWAAPETIQRGQFSKKSDVFSYGIVLSELATGTLPFHGLTGPAAAVAIVRGQRPTMPDNNDELTSIATRCWAADKATRPSFKVVLQELAPILVDISRKQR